MTNHLAVSYEHILTGLKEKIRISRLQASQTVNTQLLALYWEIGNTILQQKIEEGWGTKVIKRLAHDLQSEFPDMKGLSDRNLVYMQTFASTYPDFLITQLPVAQIKRGGKAKKSIAQLPVAQLEDSNILYQMIRKIPWTHNTVLLDKLKLPEQRLFYAQKTIENGWSKDILARQIESKLHDRQGRSITNFADALPLPFSDLAKETLKNPYLFDFLSFGEKIQEKELEKALINRLHEFLLELGRGFAYVGNQKNIVVQGDDFFLDLLFYNYHLHCFVVFELKIGDFKPAFAGQLNFYVNAIDEQLKGKEDNPTIGVLLCKTPNETVVKYALKGIKAPIGVSDYELVQALPKQIKTEMPSVEELENEMEKEVQKLKKPIDKKIEHLKNLLGNLKQEEVKENKNSENLFVLFQKVILPLRRRLRNSLDKEISGLFQQTQITLWIDGRAFKNEKEELGHLKSIKNYSQVRIDVKLNGCKQAGTKAFNAWKEIVFQLNDFNYFIAFSSNSVKPYKIKLYKQYLSILEQNKLIEQFLENIIDDITQQVNMISNELN